MTHDPGWSSLPDRFRFHAVVLLSAAIDCLFIVGWVTTAKFTSWAIDGLLAEDTSTKAIAMTFDWIVWVVSGIIPFLWILRDAWMVVRGWKETK